jgi:prepilin-type N-terminal cleavage/methylation domain-containing protein
VAHLAVLPAQPFLRLAGFTLIELLLVVAVLSATAIAAFSFSIDDRSRVRIEDTQNRLAALRRAILGVETPAYGGEMRLSGYVADNGVLPRTIADLTKQPSGMKEKGGVSPFYSSSSFDSNTCVQSSEGGTGSTELPALLKGHQGNYLSGLARNEKFRDGWGNTSTGSAVDGNDFGWLVQQGTNSLTIKSLGANNIEDKNKDGEGENSPGAENEKQTWSESEADQWITITEDDWRIPLAGWQVTVRNLRTPPPTEGDKTGTGTASPADNADEVVAISGLSAALLVFQNSDNGGKWLRYETPAMNCETKTCVLTFTTTPDCGGNKSIPLGRHLLVLLKDDKIARMKNGKIVDDDDDGTSPPITAQALFYPHADRPDITLEVR